MFLTARFHGLKHERDHSAPHRHHEEHAPVLRLDVQSDLFGQWCFIREWGRIGRAGQVRTIPYPTAADAHDALAMQQRIKERRGYWVRKPEG